MARRARSADSSAGSAVQPQVEVDEVPPLHAAREALVLRAVADDAEQLLGLVGGEAEHVDSPLGRPQQAGHQVHQRRLARAVGPDERGDAAADREVDPVDAEHLAVELRDVLEQDAVVAAHRDAAHRTTSSARILRRSISSAQDAEDDERHPAGADRHLLVERAAAEESDVAEEVGPDPLDQLAERQHAPPARVERRVDHPAERRADEEEDEERPGRQRPPADPGRDRQRQQGEQQDPDPCADEDRERHAPVRDEPPFARQRRLDAHQQQPRHPGHRREQHQEDRQLAEHVVGAADRPREIERQRAVGEVGADQRRSGERSEQEGEARLEGQEPEEEAPLERGEERRGVAHVEARQQVGGVEDVDGRRERHERQAGSDEEDEQPARGEDLGEAVAGQHEPVRGAPAPRAGIAAVAAVIDRHGSPPSP